MSEMLFNKILDVYTLVNDMVSSGCSFIQFFSFLFTIKSYLAIYVLLSNIFMLFNSHLWSLNENIFSKIPELYITYGLQWLLIHTISVSFIL